VNHWLLVILLLFFSVCNPPAVSGEGLAAEAIELYRQESYEEALQLLLAVDTSERSGLTSYYLGLAHKQSGDLAAAETAFRSALNSRLPEPRAALELASISLARDDLVEAETMIELAEQRMYKSAEAAYLRGELLLKKGDAAGATRSFTRAKSADPTISQQADIRIAQAYLNSNDRQSALDTLRNVITTNPDNELAEFAREYERRLSLMVDGGRNWRLFLGANYHYDDNAVVKPAGYVAGLNLPRKSDSSSSQSLRLIYDMPTGGEYILNSQYMLHNNSYLNLSEYSQLSQSLSLTPGYRLSGGSVSLPIAYSHTLLGYESYSWQLSAKPAYVALLSPGHVGQAAAGYARRGYYRHPADGHENRDADIYSAMLGYLYLYADGKGFANVRYEISREDADGQNWRNYGHRLLGDILLPLGEDTSLILSAEGSRQDFALNSNFAVHRQDRSLLISLALSRRLCHALYLNLHCFHAETDSNIPLYKYERNVATLGMELRF